MSCGAELPPAARFCHQCGQATAPSARPGAVPTSYTPKHLVEKILNSRSALEGERKHVTVLFADVSGYTAASERTDPEIIHSLMDRCFGAILPEVHRYEGTINQFTGDGVMALFGAPLALEDAPRRAVLAALAIQRALEPLHAEVLARHGFGFQMRVGIHAGVVVVGKIGDDLRMDYTAVGDTTNLASRIQQLASPGSVLISETVGRLVSGFFDLTDLGELKIRGRSERVRAFEVVSERAVSGRIDAAAGAGLTTLVGRTRELAVLREAFDGASAGRGQVVFIVGDPGIGKSRLLYEFRQLIRDDPHTAIEGHCTTYGRATPFHPISDGLRRGIGIEDRDDEAAALEKVERVEADLGGDLAWTLPFLRQLLSLPVGDPRVEALDGVNRRSETFQALQTRFLRLAEKGPLVLIVEDLHWIDEVSEEFLRFLAESIPAARALLIFTHRPGYRHSFGDHSYHARVALQPLTEDDSSAVVRSILATSSIPQPLQRLIAAKSEGNPFFIEEVTKSLLDAGVLRLEKGRVELSQKLDEVSVPDSIKDVLMARIDRLPEGPKRAIQIASVIGREFALRLLERISEAGERIGSVVDELRALELIYEKAAHPELAFMFKHALTHDVAYESVLVRRRKALHTIVGNAIEELYRDRLAEHYEALAHHFARGEDWERAFFYHEQASMKAAAAFANQAAAEHCRRALEIAERLGDAVPEQRRRAIERTLGGVAWCLSEFRSSGEAYLLAAADSEPPEQRAADLGRAAYSFLWAHDFSKARTTAAEALSLARAHGAAQAEAIALCSQYEQAMVEGRTEEHDLATTALERAEVSQDPEAIVRALTHEAQRLEWNGEYHRAIELAERGLRIARDERLTLLASFPQWYFALSLCALGQYNRGISELRSAIDLCDRIGDRAMKARLLNSLGWCYGEMGCHGQAREFNEQARALADVMVELELVPGAPELYANASINLAGNCTASGDLDGALEHLDPIRAKLAVAGDPWMRWRYGLHVLDGLARVALAQRDPERAAVLAHEEIEGARRHRARKLETRALELRGRALIIGDRPREGQQTLREALQVATEIQYPPATWRALSLLGELATRYGNRSEGAELSARACSLVESLAAPVSEAATRRGFGSLGERLVASPLEAYR